MVYRFFVEVVLSHFGFIFSFIFFFFYANPSFSVSEIDDQYTMGWQAEVDRLAAKFPAHANFSNQILAKDPSFYFSNQRSEKCYHDMVAAAPNSLDSLSIFAYNATFQFCEEETKPETIKKVLTCVEGVEQVGGYRDGFKTFHYDILQSCIQGQYRNKMMFLLPMLKSCMSHILARENLDQVDTMLGHICAYHWKGAEYAEPSCEGYSANKKTDYKVCKMYQLDLINEFYKEERVALTPTHAFTICHAIEGALIGGYGRQMKRERENKEFTHQMLGGTEFEYQALASGQVVILDNNFIVTEPKKRYKTVESIFGRNKNNHLEIISGHFSKLYDYEPKKNQCSSNDFYYLPFYDPDLRDHLQNTYKQLHSK